MEWTDQLQRKISLSQTPQRIISLVPSQTELLVDLGLAKKIVGITKFCEHPSYLQKNTTIVGGTKKVNNAKIKNLHPDIIICNKEENTLEMVGQLEKIAPVWISDVITFKDSLEMILHLGKLFAVEEKAQKMVADIARQETQFTKEIKTKKKQKVAYLIWKNPYMIAGKNTFIDTMLQANKFENIVSNSQSRYPKIEKDTLKKADLIVLSTEPYPFTEQDVKALQEQLHKPVVLVDGTYFSWYGSRLQKAFTYFKKLQKRIS
jgi:ABC-type Fe3+-hydroxamate transport system substrate-binding protein